MHDGGTVVDIIFRMRNHSQQTRTSTPRTTDVAISSAVSAKKCSQIIVLIHAELLAHSMEGYRDLPAVPRSAT